LSASAHILYVVAWVATRVARDDLKFTLLSHIPKKGALRDQARLHYVWPHFSDVFAVLAAHHGRMQHELLRT